MNPNKIPVDDVKNLSSIIKNNEKKIAGIRKESEIKAQEIINLLKPFIRDWSPHYNEKAVCYMPYEHFAYYVWFTEKIGNWLRFREVPNEYKDIRNYIRMDYSAMDEEWSSIVLPIEIFMPINQVLDLHIADKTK